jgi:sulfoxide reductase heme-binding subunit YedZ
VIAVASTLGPSAYWYLARATGIVSLVLLTASVVLGILGPLRFSVPGRWPRFAIDTVHRDVSLLVMVVLVVHIVTSVLDAFAPISIAAAVIPFTSAYRPLWLGLGALAFDFMIALVITSLLRRRLGYRRWRAVHWLAYASWPVAVLHGLGTGSDTKASWNLLLTVVCCGAVLAALWARIQQAKPAYGSAREAAIALAVATPIGLAVFTFVGPLQKGWARAAGTPTKLLGSAKPVVARSRPTTPAPATTPTANIGHAAFSANVSGSVSQTQVSGGAIVDLLMHLSGGAKGILRVRLGGVPTSDGGLQMTGSQVVLDCSGDVLQGKIDSLQGQQFTAHVSGGGSSLDLQANLNIDNATDTVSGSVQATPGGGA